MVVFAGNWPIENIIPLEKIVQQPILFLGYSTHALLFHGVWKLVGNITSNLQSITLPYYKIGFLPDVKLMNYKLDFIRIATEEESKLLPVQSSMSPMGYQKELQGYYGVIEWEADIKYNYKHMVETLVKLNLLSN